MGVDEFLSLLDKIENTLAKESPSMRLRYSYRRNPYTILMVTLLSLRAKDEATSKVASALFNDIQTPQELLRYPLDELEKRIKPLGMYRQKSKTLRDVSKELIERFDSTVPQSQDELLSIKGVGIKTANIVLNNAYNQGIIAVDTHVHRICNLLNLITTKTPKESNLILNEIIPKTHKSKLNFTLVVFGQTICTPKNPKCDKCIAKDVCGG